MLILGGGGGSYKISAQFPKKEARRNRANWTHSHYKKEVVKVRTGKGNRHGNYLCESGFFEKFNLKIRIETDQGKQEKNSSVHQT